MEEPSPELAVRIVKGVRAKYENHHGVEITDEAVEAAVNLSVRYVTDRYLPDKAFDIIDEACSKLKISAYAVPPRLVELGNELKSVKRRLDTTPAVSTSCTTNSSEFSPITKINANSLNVSLRQPTYSLSFPK